MYIPRVLLLSLSVLKEFRMSMCSFDVPSNIGKEKYPKTLNRIIEYGTAGFRDKAKDLDCIMYRMGLLSVLRSKFKKGKTIGIMVTASHNPEGDNGVKLVDPQGEMLEQSWESIAAELANIDDAKLAECLQQIVDKNSIDISGPASVVLGQDTRNSSVRLGNAVLAGIFALNASYTDFGVVTTPMLHYFVLCKNNSGYGTPTSDGYYKKLSTAFKLLNGPNISGNYTKELVLDGANGVGAFRMKDMLQHISREVLDVETYNAGDGILNYGCGADYVKVKQRAPEGVPVVEGRRCVSLDGDADRLIYYYTTGGTFHMLDGDRIATLLAGYIIELLRDIELHLNVGLVQTAYANGASTDYITNALKVPVACVSTGVKNLHHKALEFDVGVYFEANGHGTVVFSKKAEEAVRAAAKDPAKRDVAERISQIIDLTNQTVGDSISDILLVETVLRARGWDLNDWERTYIDLPNRLMKVTIKDRNMIETIDAGRRCVKPVGLQTEIDRIVASYSRGRAFVRPSGTEDVVRVYAESEHKDDVDRLALEIASAVYRLADGIGTPPTIG